MNRRALGTLIVMFGTTAMTAGGCARSQPTRFYILTALEHGQEVVPGGTTRHAIRVGIDPLDFPVYLDRPQIVAQEGEHRLRIAEFDRWAEPLGPRFALVLAENLSRLLNTESVVVLPRPERPSLDYRVTLEVMRFDGAVGKEVSLTARWAVHGPDDAALTGLRRSTITVPVTGPGYESVVAAMSRAVAEFSREIAGVIQNAG